MTKPVKLTPSADLDIINISDYLFYKFGINTVREFEKDLISKFGIIQNDPTRYPYYSRRNKIRKAVLAKKCIILYEETETEIMIFNVFDTRRNPNSINDPF